MKRCGLACEPSAQAARPARGSQPTELVWAGAACPDCFELGTTKAVCKHGVALCIFRKLVQKEIARDWYAQCN